MIAPYSHWSRQERLEDSLLVKAAPLCNTHPPRRRKSGVSRRGCKKQRSLAATPQLRNVKKANDNACLLDQLISSRHEQKKIGNNNKSCCDSWQGRDVRAMRVFVLKRTAR
ncbi:hypothetical protein B0J13DRAFT_529443 [Dactylonectria estremocensis]|uniref:Uncharacterized protein n=1 Tax=Dactylonectria estremocensis TaxID=1079267 RepID=A0A9P9IQJ0_9HYPO|nr:hypothetical protein B0J13DRAFT_529443 [Dactylonectria estremocensis]